MDGWMVLESGLHPTVRDRMARHLDQNQVTHRTQDDAIFVPDDARHREAFGLMDLLLDCHARILHHADPAKARPYKPLERDVILAVLLRALAHEDRDSAAFLTELLHGLVWAQGLPNTNHRSTIMLVNRLAHVDAAAVKPQMGRFVAASKPLIREKEFAGRDGALVAAHKEVAAAYVASMPRD